MVAKKKNPIDELFDQFMDGLFLMAEYLTGGALNEKGKMKNEKGKMKNPIEREQSQTSLSYAELTEQREQTKTCFQFDESRRKKTKGQREELRQMGKNETLSLGGARSKEERGGAALNEKVKMKNEKLKCEEEMTDSFLVVPIKSEQAGTEASKRKRKRQRVKMVEGELFGE